MNAGLLADRSVRAWLTAAALLVVLIPVLLGAAVTGLVADETGSGCAAGTPLPELPAGGTVAGLFASPLLMRPGRSYEVGATEYGGPGDPSSGNYGAIPNPAESYLPAHPNSFAELSLLTTNPADHGSFTFADANALGNLPYLTPIRVSHAGRQIVLLKRDIGYGQGPGETIADGQPYRLDVWWQAARALGIAKTPVTIALAPPSGSAATLEALPAPTDGAATKSCDATTGEPGLLPLVPGAAARMLPSGLAAAPEEAPAAVAAMIAAGNRLHSVAYLYGGGHGVSLDTLQPAYDCSSAVSYLLHAGGVLGLSALDSTELESYGASGPGRWVTIYANAAHAFMYVAGLRMDTVEDPAWDSGPNAGVPGPRWRVSISVPGWASWVVRHPPGL